MLVSELLIETTSNIKQAMEKLDRTAKGILLAVENGKLVGTITDGDIRRGLLFGYSFSENVSKVMCIQFKYSSTEYLHSQAELHRLMDKYKVSQLPIIDDHGEVVALVTRNQFIEKNAERSFPNKVVIMAGGKGTRLEPFTSIFPKALIPINDKPVMLHIMERFAKDGFKDFIISVNYKKEYIKLFFKDLDCDYNIQFIEEEAFLGTAGSLSLLKNQMNHPFFVVNCDSLLEVSFQDILQWHVKHNAKITIVGSHVEFKIPFGVLSMSNGRLNEILEKPTRDYVINTGMYVLEPDVIDKLVLGQHYDMPDIVSREIMHDKVSVFCLYNKWHDIGQWNEYNKAQLFFEGM